MIKARPIIMDTESVNAILDGRKTQTRRVVKPQPLWVGDPNTPFKTNDANPKGIIKCPYGQIGDRLWVKETFLKYQLLLARKGNRHTPDYYEEWYDGEFAYKADGYTTVESFKKDKIIMTDGCLDCEVDGNKWKSPLCMPRSLSRLTIEITNIKVERLQDITEKDAIAEGVEPILVPPDGGSQPYIEGYAELWDKINAKRGYSWDSNPFVWVIEFKKV